MSVRVGPGGSSGLPAGRAGVVRRLPGGGLAGRRYLLAIVVLVALATIPTLAVTQAGSHALRQPSHTASDTAPFITGGTDPVIVVASPPFVVRDPAEGAVPRPAGERPTEIGACPAERADGECPVRPGIGAEGEGDSSLPDRTRPLNGRYVIA
jgi:hypothetical protein